MFELARQRLRELDAGLELASPRCPHRPRRPRQTGDPRRRDELATRISTRARPRSRRAHGGDRGPVGHARTARITLEGEIRAHDRPPCRHARSRDAQDERSGARPRTAAADALLFGGLGLFVAGAAVGSVAGIASLSTAADVKARCEGNLCDEALRGELDRARSTATIANVAFGAAGVGLACAAVGWFLPRDRASRTPTVGLSARIGARSVALGGTF